MNTPRNPFDYPINPNFGQGIYRRRIILQRFADHITGDLEDCNHAFRISLKHDGQKITEVSGQAVRTPFTTCPGAIAPLQKLIGTELGSQSHQILQSMDARANCTHWLDLAMLAISHAKRTQDSYQYDIEVPDEADNTPTTARVYCNQELLLEWQVQNWQVKAPIELLDKPLFKGFAHWASHFSQDPQLIDAAFILQKGYFVSRARYYDINALGAESANAHASMYNACYTYSQPQRDKATRTLNTTYDFTDNAEQLLQFRQNR